MWFLDACRFRPSLCPAAWPRVRPRRRSISAYSGDDDLEDDLIDDDLIDDDLIDDLIDFDDLIDDDLFDDLIDDEACAQRSL